MRTQPFLLILTVLTVCAAPGCAPKGDGQGQGAAVPAPAAQGHEAPTAESLPPGSSAKMSELRPGAQLVTLADGTVLQKQQGATVARTRKPRNDRESALLYWKLRYGKQPQFDSAVQVHSDEPAGSSHGPDVQSERQLRIPAAGITLVYDPATQKVQEVVEYGRAL